MPKYHLLKYEKILTVSRTYDDLHDS